MTSKRNHRRFSPKFKAKVAVDALRGERSLKYECWNPIAIKNVSEARERIGAWIEFYNHERRHQGLGDRTPAAVYESDKRKAAHAA